MFSAQNRIFQNRSRRFSMPSAQLITSLGPSKSLIQAIFNGSKLDIVTARGAKNGNGQNRQKSQKKTRNRNPKKTSTRQHQRTLQKRRHAKSQPENNEK